MSFEPQKFFVGLVDFFSILMPGAVLAYLGKDWAAQALLFQPHFKLEGLEAWMLFLFSSYLLGHFLFLIGSWLDDFAYDPIRNATDSGQISLILKGENLSPKLLRWLARLWLKKRADLAVDRIVLIKESHLSRIEAPEAVNAFQWCKARLAIEHPEALAIVNRFEADSKFFRSFVPVLIGLFGMALYRAYGTSPSSRSQWGLAMGLAILLVLAFWRYMDQRLKATQQAYWFLLTLEASQAARTSQVESNSDVTTHSGGVVFRQRSDVTEYLLVQATKKPSEWVLPKGHIEVGENAKRCAIREVKEETGVWARIKRELKVVDYTVEDERVKVRYYLMEALEERRPNDRARTHKWLPLDAALSEATHQESKYLLRYAEDIRKSA